MSGKTKFPWSAAKTVAEELWSELKHVSEPNRCLVVGSLRRLKPEVGDIEILYVPIFKLGTDDLFTPSIHNMANALLDKWLDSGRLVKRPNASGHTAWGEHNKYAVHVASGIPVDFFATTIPKWFVSLVIRTGPKELNIRLCEGAQKLGATLNPYGEGIVTHAGGVIRATSEEHLFQLCGVSYAQPSKR
jgi:DNA polymerase/3'-5' exonuclease PolX